MQSYHQQQDSLHQLLQAAAATPEYIQVKPRGFKGILQSTAEFLENRQLVATLFAKLPSGESWREDIDRYCQTVGWRSRLYSFRRILPDSAPEAVLPDETIVPLADAHNWRGEYFLVIVSAEFAGMIVAHRLQPVSAAPALASEATPEGNSAQSDALHDDPIAYRSSYLSVCCSINPALIADLLTEIHQSVTSQVETAETRTELQDLLDHWSTHCPPINSASPRVVENIDRWLNWQMRQHEHLRQSVSTYKEQAMSVSNLSSQNEVLLHTLRLKDDFLNTVGQELRTPLTTIKTALTLLESSSLKAPQRQRYMDMISHECDRQSALINGVLNLMQTETSLGQVQPKALKLVDTVPPIVSTYQPLAQEKGIMLAYTVPDTVPPVICPDAWLRQIMIHLLNNSIRYTDSGGEVWVVARPAGDFAEIEVRDTGVGMIQSDIPHIFEHFYRGRNLAPDGSEGAGLGLSIVRQLLTYCGGEISVKSQSGSGTVFKVKLPLHH